MEHVARAIPGAPASDSRAALKERMVESLAELADLHDDVEIVVVELLHHARVRGAVLA